MVITSQVAFFFPSTVVTVITAAPAFTNLTTPFLSTVTYFVLLDVQVTDWFVAFWGSILTTNVTCFIAAVSTSEVLSRKTSATAITFTCDELAELDDTLLTALLEMLLDKLFAVLLDELLVMLLAVLLDKLPAALLDTLFVPPLNIHS